MSVTIEDSIKRWPAKRNTALVVEIIQGKATVAEASRAYDLSPSEIEGWVDDAKRGMENALRANPLEWIEALPSVATAPNERWSTDLCRVWAGRDGWATLALVIDCHTRQFLGWHLSGSGKACGSAPDLPIETGAHHGCVQTYRLPPGPRQPARRQYADRCAA